MRILVIDDDAGQRNTISLILGEAGYATNAAGAADEGLRKAMAEEPDIILCDVRMPGMNGLEFLDRYRAEGGEALVIMMTAYGSSDLAIQAMKRGAYDYLPKPFGADEVLLTVRKAVERESLRREVGRLRREVSAGRRYGEIIARSPAMVNALETASKVARHPSSVLITGESGTGKELVARLIHAESQRAERSFIPINCSAIPETLLESELFGYVKGAFTGATRDKEGLFEAADAGTLLLDEIGELSPPLQVKLLRVLQEGEVRRVGGTREKTVDVRIIACTNRELRKAVTSGAFRQDLYYRIAVVHIHLPPLRQRAEEIPPLTRHFIEQYNRKLSLAIGGIEPDAMRVLLSYPWPGNVRELENVIERAMVLTERPRIEIQDLPSYVQTPDLATPALVLSDDELSVKKHTAELEKRLIQRALERTRGNKTRAAELLELSSRALLYKIRNYGLE
ncbi:MAG: sigma-54-dependent Fis family transcriptional regulator [Gemmatimonadetes bacterium]|nr:sigma-54-dependent Fis family transcriptional regulator [Gemmatimonadota bacterium]